MLYFLLFLRCINGSTLLHTAAYYGNMEGVKELLVCRVDINLRDYKMATPLHRAKTMEVMEVRILKNTLSYGVRYCLDLKILIGGQLHKQ